VWRGRVARAADVVGDDVVPLAGQELRHGRPDGAGVGETVNQNHGGLRAVTQLGHRQIDASSAYAAADARAGNRLRLLGSHRPGCTTGESGAPMATSVSY